MDTSGILLQVEGISKRYDPSNRALSFREAFERVFSKKTKEKEKSFEALSQVSFQVRKGEVLGIIGKNGAGKSTILKILSGITQPSAGKVIFRGKVASILEIGTGFHPELSGRENIYLSGTLLGMTEAEVRDKEDEISRFSGISHFLDVPVKRYSSGMFLRLAFSISTHLNADILLIDEVLAVGDSAFRMKGLEKIKSLLSEGKAVVLVSHDLSSVMGLCDRVIVLKNGHIIAEGSPASIISEYIEKTIEEYCEEQDENTASGLEKSEGTFPVFQVSRNWQEKNAPGNDWLKILAFSLTTAFPSTSGEISMDDSICFEIIYKKCKTISTNLSLFVSWQLDFPVLSATPMRSLPAISENDNESGTYKVTAVFPASWFNTGLFSAGLFFITEDHSEKINLPNLIHFKIKPGAPASGPFQYDGNFPGPLFPTIHWERASISK